MRTGIGRTVTDARYDGITVRKRREKKKKKKKKKKINFFIFIFIFIFIFFFLTHADVLLLSAE